MSTETPSTSPFSRLSPIIQEDLKKLQGAWIWFVLLGVALIALGVSALTYSSLYTIATVEVIGFFLILGGATYIAGSFFTGSWGGFFLTLLSHLRPAPGRSSDCLYAVDGGVLHGRWIVSNCCSNIRNVPRSRVGSYQWNYHAVSRCHDLAADTIFGAVGDRYLFGHRSDF